VTNFQYIYINGMHYGVFYQQNLKNKKEYNRILVLSLGLNPDHYSCEGIGACQLCILAP